MFVTILDIYSKSTARISKDTNGGFGTVNDYGDGFISKLLTKVKAKSVDWPPLYSLYCASVLKSQGHCVNFLRGTLEQFDIDSLLDQDLCILTTSIVCHETEIKLIKKIKKERPELTILAIGSVATVLTENYIDAGAVVLCGEPEFYFKQNPDLKALKTAKGVLTIDFIEDLDSLEFPAWDLIYKSATPRYKLLGRNETFLPILASRGCPYSCYHYCTYPLQQGRKLRTRSSKNILDEMIYWQDKLGISLFLFRDPVFSINRAHTIELMEKIINSGRTFKFIIETHLKNLDEELILLLKKAGLVMVKVGVECNNTLILKNVNRYSLENTEEYIKFELLKKNNVALACFYMFGIPGETPNTCKQTIDYALKINSYGAQFSVFTPYPGTPLFLEYKNKLLTHNFENFTQWHLVFKHENLSQKQIRKILNSAYTRYYTRPSWIIGKFIKNFLTKK